MPILIHAAAGMTGCNEACYDAKAGICSCVCGGINHGRGFKRASENARRIAERQGQQSLFDLSNQPSAIGFQPSAEQEQTI
jgi:hypothetical protein